uniref:Uncharacterized protein n=1 Tax=Arundo donax TaxID=35708 RepID=A0A0A8ZFX7_ARUDO
MVGPLGPTSRPHKGATEGDIVRARERQKGRGGVAQCRMRRRLAGASSESGWRVGAPVAPRHRSSTPSDGSMGGGGSARQGAQEAGGKLHKRRRPWLRCE